jgi:hypothetical protein
VIGLATIQLPHSLRLRPDHRASSFRAAVISVFTAAAKPVLAGILMHDRHETGLTPLVLVWYYTLVRPFLSNHGGGGHFDVCMLFVISACTLPTPLVHDRSLHAPSHHPFNYTSPHADQVGGIAMFTISAISSERMYLYIELRSQVWRSTVSIVVGSLMAAAYNILMFYLTMVRA